MHMLTLYKNLRLGGGFSVNIQQKSPDPITLPDLGKLLILFLPEELLMVGEDSLQTLCDASHIFVHHFF